MAIVQLCYCCICYVQLKPWDYLVSGIFQRHQMRQSEKETKVLRRLIHNNTLNMEHINNPKEQSIYLKLNVSSIEEGYAIIHNNDVVPESTKRIQQ
ncbi:unnamed protein product [Rotaria sordida]|uniref:Uncharacterized protein n=1 Tax=Rotaria sordida TaxID=392033 RepID=A0A819QKG0_9BILA|nr:unnamed protein product [Rotaria sordida]CAF4033231.1 unnamed protein product [Rotaria sordida]